MPADDAPANLGVGRVQGNAQRADVLLDDARLVLGRQVGERDERSRQEAEAEVVVAQGQRRAHVVGQLAHEAEDAGVAALLDAVEHHAGELEAPLLALIALKLHLAGITLGYIDTDGDSGEVELERSASRSCARARLTINAGDDATRVKPASSAGLSGSIGSDDGLRGSGARRLRPPADCVSLLRHILRRINAHVNTAFPLPLPVLRQFFKSISCMRPHPPRRMAETRRGKSAQLSIRRNCLLPGGMARKSWGEKRLGAQSAEGR